MNLKKRDKKLLYEYCRNSRLPLSVLARKSRMSQQLVSYKVKSFHENKVIGFSYPLVDYSMFGLLNFHVHFRINYKSKRTYNDILSALTGHEDVVEVTERGGNYDLIVTFATKNPSSFNKTLKQLVEDNPDQLKNHMILTNVVSHFFPRKYMVGLEDNTADTIIGGDREMAGITDKEKKVLELLSGDARSRITDIARKAGINPRTAIGVIKRLQHSGVLQGFSSVLNLKETGIVQGMMLLKYHNLSTAVEDKLRDYCITQKNITEMHKLFGNFDIAITVEAENSTQLRDVFIDIRERFEEIINDSDSFRIYRIRKRSMMPSSFFN